MAGLKPSKTASLTPYVPAIHDFAKKKKDVDARDKRGHDAGGNTNARPQTEFLAAL